ncbi:50S ribosomal protein L25 [Paenibacillus sp. NFR01]|uniref:50S ribosomal protein L25 n=1 Tax=Paenibacillus sp. NFR01 TaxID=1566279 RepID=UPI0008CA3C59|nr:50S ribosomal protein L25 [Paenibacillus sp. NFR01]SET46781.1 large subunit ribosomal protein L25 [Paenibacillus sp. NFR01]
MENTVRLTERTGKAAAERRRGFVPVVVYGAGSETKSYAADVKALNEILGRNPRAILKVTLPGSGTANAVIQEAQRKPLSRELLHIDLHKIDMKSELDTKVALHFVGDSAGVRAGGIQQVELYELDIRTLPDKLKPSLEVDISGLEIGGQLHVSDLPPQEGWTILTPEDTLIVRIATPAVYEEPETEEAAAPQEEVAAAAESEPEGE